MTTEYTSIDPPPRFGVAFNLNRPVPDSGNHPYQRNPQWLAQETLLERLFPVHIRRMNDFTAVIKHDNEWWYGWIEEVPGVNAQERSREELIVALRECLSEAIEMNRRDALESAEHDYSEEPIAL